MHTEFINDVTLQVLKNVGVSPNNTFIYDKTHVVVSGAVTSLMKDMKKELINQMTDKIKESL